MGEAQIRRRSAKLRPFPKRRPGPPQAQLKAKPEGRRPYYPSDFKAREPKNRLLHVAKARAKKQGVPFTLTPDDLEIPDLCPVLGILLYSTDKPGGGGNAPSLIMADPELGFVPGNVVVVSAVVPRIMADATPEELFKIADYFEAARADAAQPTPAKFEQAATQRD